MDEHLALLELSGEVRRRLQAGDRSGARSTLARAAALLDQHVRREEAGVFTALKQQGDFVDAVEDLEAEHDSFDAALAALDEDDPDFADRAEALLAELAEHIDKENLGVFPVAVVTLGAGGWETVGRVHADQPSFLAGTVG